MNNDKYYNVEFSCDYHYCPSIILPYIKMKVDNKIYDVEVQSGSCQFYIKNILKSIYPPVDKNIYSILCNENADPLKTKINLQTFEKIINLCKEY